MNSKSSAVRISARVSARASAHYVALIPCAGMGERVGASMPKQYLPLLGKPMVWHTVQAFLAHPQIAHVYVVVSQNDNQAHAILNDIENLTVLRVGGKTRRDSVLNGLKALQRDGVDKKDWVMVHDAARPGITVELISRLIQAVDNKSVGGLLALPVVDTLKHEGQGIEVGHASKTVARKGLWAAQTPQMFRAGILLQALQAVTTVTDEASAIEALGHAPKLIHGHLGNFKVTLPEDVALAEWF